MKDYPMYKYMNAGSPNFKRHYKQKDLDWGFKWLGALIVAAVVVYLAVH